VDPSTLDRSPGIAFANKVRSLLRAPVASLSPGNRPSFRLWVAFGRCLFRLTLDSAGSALQSVLGAEALDFCLPEVSDRIYEFWVSSKAVGFMVYNFKHFACDYFKCCYFLSNDSGLSQAKTAISAENQPQFKWVTVSSRKRNRSYAEVAKSQVNIDH
jgi:hypothetical protein